MIEVAFLNPPLSATDNISVSLTFLELLKNQSLVVHDVKLDMIEVAQSTAEGLSLSQ
jgi:hypothetical protein